MRINKNLVSRTPKNALKILILKNNLPFDENSPQKQTLKCHALGVHWEKSIWNRPKTSRIKI
jgi:hypothetical protein